jgi:RecA-family ATPase
MTALKPTPLRLEERAERVPPYNTEAEQALLGAIFIRNDVFHRVAGFLCPDDFGNAVHGRIFAATARLISAGIEANPVTLKNLFDQDGALVDIGGAQYLARLAAAAVTVVNTEDYAKIIVDLAQRRAVIAALDDARDAAYMIDFQQSAGDILACHQSRLAEISRGTPDRLTLFDPTTLSGAPVPDRLWIVPHWIPMKRATGLYGVPGAGKTILAQLLCTAASVDKPWLGLRVRRCKSVLFYCEDDIDEMHIRQDAINRFYGCTYDDLGMMRWLPRLGGDNAMMTFEHGRGVKTPLFQQMLGEVKAFGAQLVIMDTLSDVFAGNEIDRNQARHFVQQCLALMAREINGGVIACAHPSLSGIKTDTGESGSTGWGGAFRSRLYLNYPKTDKDDDEPTDTDERLLTGKKSNWAKAGDFIEMRWHDGVFIGKSPPTGIITSIERRTAERAFLDLLDAVTTERQPVSPNVSARNYAPRVFARRPAAEREGFKIKDFEQAMRGLIKGEKPQIIAEQYGRRGDERWRISRAPALPPAACGRPS